MMLRGFFPERQDSVSLVVLQYPLYVCIGMVLLFLTHPDEIRLRKVVHKRRSIGEEALGTIWSGEEGCLALSDS